ncbi:hypothetical protein KKC13_10765 [bacterium]|nr:hypothetical protein [bacterium]MBU1958224.1 hypothetical protein [bacterium]
MFKRLFIPLTILLFSFTACSSMINKKSVQLPLTKKYAISSFWNYTETPMAGLRAASIVESVLSEKNILLFSLIDGSDEIELSSTKTDFLTRKIDAAKSMGADYLITGNVQEWRYKTGIDGEPVVSYSIKVLDLKQNSVVFNAVGAKSGWGHKSIGVVAQEIAENIAPRFFP